MDSYYFVLLLLTFLCISHTLTARFFSICHPFSCLFSRRCLQCVLLFSGVIVVVFVVILVVIADIFYPLVLFSSSYMCVCAFFFIYDQGMLCRARAFRMWIKWNEWLNRVRRRANEHMWWQGLVFLILFECSFVSSSAKMELEAVAYINRQLHRNQPTATNQFLWCDTLPCECLLPSHPSVCVCVWVSAWSTLAITIFGFQHILNHHPSPTPRPPHSSHTSPSPNPSSIWLFRVEHSVITY